MNYLVFLLSKISGSRSSTGILNKKLSILAFTCSSTKTCGLLFESFFFFVSPNFFFFWLFKYLLYIILLSLGNLKIRIIYQNLHLDTYPQLGDCYNTKIY
jgi:hypothetical protein